MALFSSKKTIIWSLLAALGLCLLLLGMLPWKLMLAERIRAMLETQGVHDVGLELTDIGLKEAALSHVTIGADKLLTLERLDISYSPLDLWRGRFRELSLSGLTIQARQTPKTWVVTGLESWMDRPRETASKPFSLPVTAQEIDRIPFEGVSVKDSDLVVQGRDWDAALPFNIVWKKDDNSRLDVDSEGLRLKKADLEVRSGPVKLSAHLESAAWQGTWTVDDIMLSGAAVPVPSITGTGTLTAEADRLQAAGKFQSADSSYKAEFTVSYPFDPEQEAVLVVTAASLPWKEGKLSAKNVRIPLRGNRPLDINLQVENVSIDELLQSVTGKRVTATGVVSGTMPLTIGRDGSLTVHKGNLRARGPGRISMPPDALPGENEQVNLVRKILADLQYSSFSIQTSTDAHDKLAILLSLEGRNPKVYDGRAVKLTVNLTGDVLDFIRKNIIFLTDPEQILKQGADDQD